MQHSSSNEPTPAQAAGEPYQARKTLEAIADIALAMKQGTLAEETPAHALARIHATARMALDTPVQQRTAQGTLDEVLSYVAGELGEDFDHPHPALVHILVTLIGRNVSAPLSRADQLAILVELLGRARELATGLADEMRSHAEAGLLLPDTYWDTNAVATHLGHWHQVIEQVRIREEAKQ